MASSNRKILNTINVMLCLYICAVFIHVCSSRKFSRTLSEAEVARTREELSNAFDKLKELTQNSNDKLELEELTKMINTADKKTVQFGKQYLRYINELITKKKEGRQNNLYDKHQRRFMGWFKNIFIPSSSTSTTTSSTTTTTTTPRTTTPYVPKVTTEGTESVAEVNLTLTLNKLIDVLYKLNENIKQSNNDTLGFYVVKVPVSVTTTNNNNLPLKRFKREELKTQTEATVVKTNNETEKTNASNVDYQNAKHSEDSKRVHDVVSVPVAIENVKRNKRDISSPMTDLTIEKVKQNTTDFQNETSILDSVVTNVTNELLNRANTRRNFSPQNNIRAKLFSHLYDIFDDIKLKLEPVLRIKNEHNNNVAFKVGYISANLDSLGSNLVRLRTDMEENARVWSDSKILELFDVLKIHHDVVVRLLDSLRLYLHVKPDYSFD